MSLGADETLRPIVISRFFYLFTRIAAFGWYSFSRLDVLSDIQVFLASDCAF